MSHPQRLPNAIDSDRRGVSEEDKAAWRQGPVASACKLSNVRPFLLQLLQLIAKSQLTSLSGVAQKNYFNILDKIVRKVLDDHQNPRLIKDLLQDLSSTLCILIRGVGKSVLVGNINIWICRLETILHWQQQLQNLQVTKVNDGLTLSDLPLHMLNNILYRLSDGWDIVTLGQVTPTLSMLSEDRHLWKKLCQYHFAEKQVSVAALGPGAQDASPGGRLACVPCLPQRLHPALPASPPRTPRLQTQGGNWLGAPSRRLLGSEHQPDAAPHRPLSLHHSLLWKTSPPSGTALRAACSSPRPQPAAPTALRGWSARRLQTDPASAPRLVDIRVVSTLRL
ncbi:uncharacterized protein LOC102737413 [Leptonychotes weddellii]|uniref:F-box only protein 25 n=1 Tax=Leptonychotes weddellii TaxID=9713 RepID=A0A7F8RJS5_LEPWE|nr:uncharacterized protein LOC102737413 [Leptonychotes weddellii]